MTTPGAYRNKDGEMEYCQDGVTDVCKTCGGSKWLDPLAHIPCPDCGTCKTCGGSGWLSNFGCDDCHSPMPDETGLCECGDYLQPCPDCRKEK